MTLLLGDLLELKSMLDIDPLDLSEDKKLRFMLEMASGIIEETLNRDLSYKSRVKVYQGTGTQKLLLLHRPVYPAPPSPYSAISVVYDNQGNFGQNPGAFADSTTIALTYGIDYTLKIDQDDGGSRSGILIRLTDYWQKPQVRQAGLLSAFVGDDTGSYQVTSTAGYTLDTLPATFRWAVNLLVARMRYLMPVGMEIAAESYEERAIAIVAENKNYLMGLVKNSLMTFRNYKWVVLIGLSYFFGGGLS